MSNPIESEKELLRRNKLKLQRLNKADSVDWDLIRKAIKAVDKGIQSQLTDERGGQ